MITRPEQFTLITEPRLYDWCSGEVSVDARKFESGGKKLENQ